MGYLFPGQGAQYVGMGKDLFREFPSAKKKFFEADHLLGYELSRFCFEGPEEELTRTLYAQPAIFVTSFAALTVLREKFSDLELAFTAGLSLGEFTALVAAGSISFEDGLRLVKARADAMENAARKNPGTMASILGLAQSECEMIAKESGCEVANLNAPDQMVISGSMDSIERACRLAESKGAKRVLRLKVGGAFHSALMQAAKESFEKSLAQIKIQVPHCIFIPNATAEKTFDPEQIRNLLAQQLVSPVRWIETMEQAQKEGISFFLEIGPGKVLKGLARKCQPGFTVEPCGTPDDFQKLEPLFGGVVK
jgi:[acyl-carrier-protein] S-malonyltransferase